MIKLHSAVENLLEAPALAWSSLAWYWGFVVIGLGPRYREYMQSGEWEIDQAFYGNDGNEDINRIPGYEPPVTIKQKFDRAINFYEYCCVSGKQTSINPPWDYPPDIDTIIQLRNTFQSRPQHPNETVAASTDDIFKDNEDFMKLWDVGGALQREERARKYAIEVRQSIEYVRSEVNARLSLTLNQLSKETGFLNRGSVRIAAGVTAEDMDEAMPEEKQLDKLGECYVQTLIRGSETYKKVTTTGIIGRYYKAGHQLESAMWSPEKQRELSGIHNAIVRTWNQLMELKQNA